jgi:uncharacterized delta-60 repeat protein
MALQTDGKMIVAGTFFNYYDPLRWDLTWDMSIIRLLPDGRVDSSFNNTGVLYKILPYGSRMSALNLQADGKILITLNKGMLLRYQANGDPDATFNDSGIVNLGFLSPYDVTSATALQPDGKILLTGRVYNQDLLLTRLHPNGRIDSSFGYYGIVNTMIDSVGSLVGNCIAVQRDNKIIVGGGAEGKALVIRYLPDGTLDAAFNSGKGYKRFAFADQMNTSVQVVRILSGDSLLLAGMGFSPSVKGAINIYSCLGKMAPTGSLDVGFGKNGIVIPDTTMFPETFGFFPTPAIVVQADGKILMSAMNGDALFNKHFSLWRFMREGKADHDFGTNGRVITALTSKNDYPWDLAIQPDNKILLAGVANWDTTWPHSPHAAPSVVRYRVIKAPVVPDDTVAGDLLQIYPNPVKNDFISLRYRLASPTDVNIQLWNVLGQLVRQWSLTQLSSKTVHEEQLLLPAALPIGNYVLRLIAGEKEHTTVLLKQ